ncbi:hypothetical protein [Alkalinema sp. FACHB-956]|uniref:hypothetical protein n=1 Tax=Alkalinema sp. FACHB-956 TaxID=2692768 RepID=UPI00168604B3|nr:hypothetical protein [Alkalinema sp. FACHB-956]MBD2325268.1 hypothetical protein [Alkalinema sp. FACHB-956]
MVDESKRLVVDASIARSCGDATATYPTSVRCRDFLLVLRDCKHKVVMTQEIRAEWDKHQSRFARQWLRGMISRKQFIALPAVSIDQTLWEAIEAMADTDPQRAAMVKDILLLEAALATDRSIVSLDEKTARRFFTQAAQKIAKLREIVWVNPDRLEEEPIEWLKAGAPADAERMLGF